MSRAELYVVGETCTECYHRSQVMERALRLDDDEIWCLIEANQLPWNDWCQSWKKNDTE